RELDLKINDVAVNVLDMWDRDKNAPRVVRIEFANEALEGHSYYEFANRLRERFGMECSKRGNITVTNCHNMEDMERLMGIGAAPAKAGKTGTGQARAGGR
ncbi:MAG: hypothetical protein KGJ06_07340, partial [Pseudomonadota bacterium]|nr:hypothetical protein [Pseudomonadota bacterium]